MKRDPLFEYLKGDEQIERCSYRLHPLLADYLPVTL